MHFRILRDHSLSLFACGLLACSSAASENPSAAEESLASADGSLSATLTLQSQWAGGYCANVAIANGGKQTSTTWSVTVALNGSAFSNGWNAQLAQTSTQITGSNLAYNGSLAPAASTSWGFCGTGAGLPTLVTVAGSGGSAGGGSAGAGSAGAGGTSGSGGKGGSSGGMTSSGGAAGKGGSAGTAGVGGGAGAGGAGAAGTGGTSGACNPGTTHTGGTQHCSNSQGNLAGGYSFQYWASTAGSGCMTPYGGGDAAFKANWSNAQDFLARVGLGWSATQTFAQLGTISADYAYTKTGSGGGFSFIGIYGWSENPLVEYYIVDDWFGGGPPTGGGTKKGSFVIDGGTYNVYTHTQTNQPAITGGNATFQQFFSVRQTPRQCGHISITEHFKEWASLGMTLGKMEEARLLVEVGGGTGSIDFTTATVTAK